MSAMSQKTSNVFGLHMIKALLNQKYIKKIRGLYLNLLLSFFAFRRVLKIDFGIVISVKVDTMFLMIDILSKRFTIFGCKNRT